MKCVRKLGILLALGSAATSLACQDYRIMTEQVPTVADMQNTAFKMQRTVDEKGEISEEEAREILRTWPDHDSWGNPLIFLSRREPQFSFLLISTGSDGKPDIDDLDRYFDWEQEDIVGLFSRDIVYRDGRAVTIASNK